MRLPADVAISDGESLQFTTMTGSDHGEEEVKLDNEVGKRHLAERFERGTRKEA